MNLLIHHTDDQDKKSYRRRRTNRKRKNMIISVIAVILFPIYPASGSYLYHKTGGVTVYEVDESTILESYDGNEYFEKVSIDGGGFIEANVAIDDKRDWKNQEDIIKYLVQSGDTLGELSESFGISTDTIKWANDLGTGPLKAGRELTILPVDGVVHTVQKGEGIRTIASKYKIDGKIDEIIAVNKMSGIQDLQVDQKIILPGAVPLPKPKPQPVVQPKPTYVTRSPNTATTTTTNSGNDYSFAGATEYLAQTDENGYYPLNLKVTSGCRNFAFGNCTCFVAKYKNVTWRGNAKAWLKNAQAQGVPTGSTPQAGAIAVYAGPGTHPVYGHVSIVRKVEAEHIVVTDMNYRRYNEVTTRRERRDHPAIIGYIYVD